MTFDLQNVRTAVTACAGEVGKYGYFANNLTALRKAVTKEQISLQTIYDRLDSLEDASREHRFTGQVGSFALFYPMDNVNMERY